MNSSNPRQFQPCLKLFALHIVAQAGDHWNQRQRKQCKSNVSVSLTTTARGGCNIQQWLWSGRTSVNDRQ